MAVKQEHAAAYGRRRSGLVHDVSWIAVLYVLATVLGFARDVFVVRAVGYGSRSDEYFLLTQLPLVCFGVCGQSTYLPLAIANPRVGRRFLQIAIVAFIGVTLLLVRTSAVSDAALLAGSLSLSYVMIAMLGKRVVACAKAGRAARLAAVQLVATVIFMAAFVVVPRNALTAVLLFAFSLPIAIAVVLPRSPSNYASDAEMHAPSELSWYVATSYVVASVAVELQSLVERYAAAHISIGAATSLAIGAKIANLPAGMVGYAVGTALFVRIVSGGTTALNLKSRFLGLSPYAYLLIGLACSVIGVAVVWLSSPIIVSIFAAPASSHERLLIAAYAINVAPIAFQSSLLRVVVARRDWAIYRRAVFSSALIYLVLATLAVWQQSALILPLALAVNLVVQIVVILRQPGMDQGRGRPRWWETAFAGLGVKPSRLPSSVIGGCVVGAAALTASALFVPMREVALILFGAAWLVALFWRTPTVGLTLFSVVSVYRLAEPTLLGSALFRPTVSDANELIFAAFLCVRWSRLLRAVSGRVWLLAAATSQLLPGLLSVPTSLRLSRSLGGAVLTLAQCIIIVAVARWVGMNPRNGRLILRSILVAGVVAAVLALAHVHGPYSGATEYAATTVGTVVRVSGVSGNALAGLLLVCFAIVLAEGTELGWDLRRALLACFFVTVIVLTFVRGALIDLLVLLSLTLLLGRMRRGASIRLAVLAVAGAVIAGATLMTANPIHARLDQALGAQSTLGTRLQLWRAAWHIIATRPLLGVGVKNFNSALSLFYPARLPASWYQIFQYPEQQLLGLAAETGLIGLAIYEWSMIRIAWRAIRQRSSTVAPAVSLAVGSVMVGRVLSEILGTWLTGNDFLLLVLGGAVGLVTARRNDGDQLLDRELSVNSRYAPTGRALAGRTAGE